MLTVLQRRITNIHDHTTTAIESNIKQKEKKKIMNFTDNSNTNIEQRKEPNE